MPNPNPKTEQLALGRGKRPKLNNQTVGMRMSQATRQRLEQIAQSYDCFYGGKPWIAGLFEKVASGDLMIVPAPPKLPELVSQTTTANPDVVDSRQLLRDHLAQKHYVSSDHGEATSSKGKKGEDFSDTCMSGDSH